MADCTVDDVRAALWAHGIEVRELEEDTSTALLASEALGTSVGAIVKSLLFIADGEPVLVLASGDRVVNPAKLAGSLRAEHVKLARPKEVLRLTGYGVGGVPPLGHHQAIRTLLDRHLLDFPEVWAAAGSPHAVFPVTPRQLLEITGAELTDAVE